MERVTRRHAKLKGSNLVDPFVYFDCLFCHKSFYGKKELRAHRRRRHESPDILPKKMEDLHLRPEKTVELKEEKIEDPEEMKEGKTEDSEEKGIYFQPQTSLRWVQRINLDFLHILYITLNFQMHSL